MHKLSVDHVEMSKNDLIMVFWHKKSGLWWATIGDQRSAGIRDCGQGATAVEAIAELMLLIGGKVENPT